MVPVLMMSFLKNSVPCTWKKICLLWNL